MSQGDKKTKKSGMTGVWLVALGALGGILLAPMSGRETRHKIGKEIDDGYRYLASLGQTTRQEAGHIAESGRRIARKATH